MFELILRHNPDRRKKTKNRKNRKLPNIESHYEEIIEKDKEKYNIYTPIQNKKTKTKYDNKHMYQS